MWRKTKRWPGVGLVALLTVGPACSDDAPTAPDAEALTSAEVEQLAVEDEAFLAAFMTERFTAEATVVPDAGLALSVEPIVTEGEFSWTRDCPGGGRVEVDGAFRREVDREAGTAAVSVEGEKRKEGCVHRRGDVRVTVDARSEFEAHREWENRRLVAATKRVEGAFSYETSDGRSGECEFELHAEWDPETRRIHITGSYCGREIDRSIDRGESDG